MRSRSTILMVDGHERGFTTFRAALIQDLVESGHRVVAAAPNTTLATKKLLNDESVELVDIPLERTSRSPMSLMRACAALVREIRELQPDVVLAFGPKSIVASGISSALTGTKYIPAVTGIGSVFMNGLSSISALAMVLLLKASLRKADHIVFQNSDNLASFRRWRIIHRSQQTHIVNGSGVPTNTWQQTPLPPTPPLRFIFVGRVLNSKGVREFDLASRKIASMNPSVEFRAIGWYEPTHPDSPSAAWFESFCRGPISYGGKTDDVLGELRKAHVFVLPSYSEGVPRSGLEALAVGRPVITTDAPGCRELIGENQNGFLVARGDTDSLVGAMSRYIDDTDLLHIHGAESRRLAETRFSDQVVIGQWKDILEFSGVGK